MTDISKAHILLLGIYHKAIITATGKDSTIMAYRRIIYKIKNWRKYMSAINLT